MYEFIDTTKQKHYRNLPFIPTSAMSYDGTWLEELIEGYQTLSVEGREMYSLSFETQEMQVGGVITNVKYPPRELTIKYKLEDRDPQALQEKFDTLKAYLIRQEDVPIIFHDDLEYTFYGRFQTADNVPGDTNSIISSFTVLCSDPFKHGKTQSVKNKVIEVLPYPVKPDKLSFKLPADETGYSVKTPYFHTAWSYSADGTDRFTTVYPNLNLIEDGKFAKPISSKWNIDGTTISKDSITGYFRVNFAGTGSYNRAYYTASVSTIPIGQKYSVYIKAYSLEDSLNIKLGTVNTSQAVTVTKNGNIPKIYKADGLVRGTSDTFGIFGGLITTLGTLFVSEIKVEQGSTATPYMPSSSEVKTSDYPSYIGQYSDFTQADSANPPDYTWSLDGLAGKAGVKIKTTVITYAISTSGTTAPTTGWTSSVPGLVKGHYLWTETVWTYTDNTSKRGYSVTYIAKDGNNGNDGIAGKDGTSIKTTTITYAGSTSGTKPPTSGWTSTVPTVAAGSYLWTKTVWAYIDDTGGLLATDGNYRLKSSQAKKGDLLEFDFQTGDTLLNGKVNNNLLDLDSDFKNIRLTTGTDFSSSNYELTIKYRKAVL